MKVKNSPAGPAPMKASTKISVSVSDSLWMTEEARARVAISHVRSEGHARDAFGSPAFGHMFLSAGRFVMKAVS